MSELCIKILTPEAAPRIAELEKLCFSVPWSEDSVRYALEDELHLWLGLVENGEIIGYAGVQIVLDEGFIDNVAVHPDKRSRGYAKRLIDELCKESKTRGAAALMLEVRPSNAPAIKVYESAGFERVGFRPVYYDNPKEGAILMTKYLRAGEENADTCS